MNAGKAFFDTNVLLYIYSAADLRKQAIARQVFKECRDSGRIVLSTQVVQEFHAVGSRKLRIPQETLRTLTTGLLDLPLEQVEPAHIRRALWGEEHYRISFWDALILAAAESARAGILYTEDLNDGQQYGTVRVENPFRESQEE
jgi:predicted nucleic acid-binding protein